MNEFVQMIKDMPVELHTWIYFVGAFTTFVFALYNLYPDEKDRSEENTSAAWFVSFVLGLAWLVTALPLLIMAIVIWFNGGYKK